MLALQSCIIAAIAEPIIITAIIMPISVLHHLPLLFSFFALPFFAIASLIFALTLY